MSSKLVSLFASVSLLAASSAAQFSAFDWTFTTSGPAATMNASVSGPDELSFEILNGRDNGFGVITAEAVATDTGRMTFTLHNVDFGGQGGPGAFCGGTDVSAGNACFAGECPVFAVCFDPVMTSGVPASSSGAKWMETWTIDVVEGECWQIGIAQDAFSFGCSSRLTASDLVFEPAPDIALTSVDGTPAYKATAVMLTGTGLDAVTQVLVDGDDAPILTQSPTQITIRPPVAPAGFADIVLRDETFLLASASGALTKWPAASATVSSGTLDVAVEAGLSGDWQLVVSLGTMPPAGFGPTTFGALTTDVVSSRWFWVPGVLDHDGLGDVAIAIPQAPGLSGLEVFVQARTAAGFASPFTAAFSNRVDVVLP